MRRVRGNANSGLVAVKRFFRILCTSAFVHACFAITLASVATARAEREVLEGRLPAHAVFRFLGAVAEVLFYPLILLRTNVYEPRTTILFIGNSLIWGIAIAALWGFASQFHRRRQVGTSKEV